MTLDPEFLAVMPDTVMVQKTVGRDAWGSKVGGIIHVCPGRVESRRRKVINAAGVEVVSNTTVYLATTSGITPDDTVILPSGYPVVRPNIIEVRRPTDEEGFHHTVLYC